MCARRSPEREPDLTLTRPLTVGGVAKVVLVLATMVTVAPLAAAIALGVGYLRRPRG